MYPCNVMKEILLPWGEQGFSTEELKNGENFLSI
jgi:hypothetical protein